MAGLAGGAMLRQSVTYDEVANLGAGLSYLQRLDLRMNSEHPPLPKMLAAVPLVLRGTRADYTHISWRLSETFSNGYSAQLYFGEMVLNHWNDPGSTLTLARLPMLGLTVLLGCLVYVIACRLGGPWGGLLSLCLYVTTPTFLAHGTLVHEDVAIAFFALWAAWTFAELVEHPRPRAVPLFACALAGAFLSKFTAGVLVIALAAALVSAREARRNWRPVLASALGAAAIVYCVYLVFSWNQPTGGGVLARLELPVRLYARGLYFVMLTSSRNTFLLGHAYPHGVWFYFPVLLLLKSAPGFLGVLAVGILAKLRPGPAVIPKAVRFHWRVLVVTLCVFATVCILSRLNIGFRHFSVPLVLMVLLAAPIPRLLAGRWPRVLVAALAASCVVSAAIAYPHYLPYHNIFSAGRPTYLLFNDSNLDWGQALPEVKRFADSHGLRRIAVDSYGFTNILPVVPQAELWNCEAPSAGDAGRWVAVSANMIADVRNCTWLMRYPHEELGGGAMDAVRLPSPIPPAGSAGGPPVPAERRSFLQAGDGSDARKWFVDCAHNPDLVRTTTEGGARILESWSTGWCDHHFPRSALVRKWTDTLIH